MWQAAGRAGRAVGAARHGRCRQRARGRAEQAAAGARGARQAGCRRWARAGHAAGTRQGAGHAAGRRWARGARAAWAPGLALGSVLGALGPFSIRFDSFFFPESPNEHCSL